MRTISNHDGALQGALVILIAASSCWGFESAVRAQNDGGARGSRHGIKGAIRPVTVPVTTRIRGSKALMELQAVDLTLREDDEEQRVVSVRSIGTAPLSVAVLIQDDLVPSVSSEIRSFADFIRNLPEGSRVLVGYIRSGSLQVRQRFTTDRDRAAAALRIPIGSSSAAPYNPYVEITEALKRFDSQPGGRRAVLVVSDGLDSSRGIDLVSLSQSIDAERSIREAQRRSVAIYAFFAPTVGLEASRNTILSTTAQGMLQRVSSETGGQAFFSGNQAPVSFEPFLKELETSLARQIAVTYLSTHLKKGFHRINIKSRTPGIEIYYPAGNTR